MKPYASVRCAFLLVALATAGTLAAQNLTPAVERRIRMNTSSAVNANWPFKFGGPYYSP